MRLKSWGVLFTMNQRRGSLAQLCAEHRSRFGMAPTLLGLGYAALIAAFFTPILRQAGLLFFDDWSPATLDGSVHSNWRIAALGALAIFFLALPIFRLGVLDQLWRNTDLSQGRSWTANRRLRLAQRLLWIDFAVIGFLFGVASSSADLSLRPGYLLLVLSAALTASGVKMIDRAMNALVPTTGAHEVSSGQHTTA